MEIIGHLPLLVMQTVKMSNAVCLNMQTAVCAQCVRGVLWKAYVNLLVEESSSRPACQLSVVLLAVWPPEHR